MKRFLAALVIFIASCSSLSAEQTYEIDAKKDNIRIYNFSDHSIYVEFYFFLNFFVRTGNLGDYSTSKMGYGLKVPANDSADIHISNWTRWHNFSLWSSLDGHLSAVIWKSKKKADNFQKEINKGWAIGELSSGVSDLIRNVMKEIRKDGDDFVDGMLGAVEGIPVEHSFATYWGRGIWSDVGTVDTALVTPSARKFALYQEDHFGGTPFAPGFDYVKSFAKDYKNFDNRASSLIVYSDAWTFYRKPDYGGEHKTKHRGYYRDADAMGIGNNTISSYKKK